MRFKTKFLVLSAACLSLDGRWRRDARIRASMSPRRRPGGHNAAAPKDAAHASSIPKGVFRAIAEGHPTWQRRGGRRNETRVTEIEKRVEPTARPCEHQIRTEHGFERRPLILVFYGGF